MVFIISYTSTNHYLLLLGCKTISETARRIVESHLLHYCNSPSWPNVRVRLDFVIKWCAQRIIEINQCKIRNTKSIANQFRKESLIGMNNYSFANSLAMEVINTKTVGNIDKKYKATATVFQSLSEYKFIPLYNFEPSERRGRLKFYEALQLKSPGAHFGRPFILVMFVT